MAQKLGSEFLKEFDNFEPPVLFGRTKRQLVVSCGMVFGIVISVLLYVIHFPTLITYVIVGLILIPTFIYGQKKDVELKERYRFRLTIQTRSYQTDYNWKEEVKTTDGFIPKKGVTEVDQGREIAEETAETQSQA